MAARSSNGAEIKAASASRSRHRLERLVDRKAVQEVFERGRKAVAAEVVLYYLRRDGGGVRFAVHTRKALGRAVDRNRVRRLFKEAVRKRAEDLCGVDFILLPRKAAVRLGFHRVADLLAGVLSKIAK